MSLDSFMGRQRTPKPTKTPPSLKETPTSKTGLEKRVLKCPNAKCKYERVVVKAKLMRNDLECPKCGTLMKESKRIQKNPDDEESSIENGQ